MSTQKYSPFYEGQPTTEQNIGDMIALYRNAERADDTWQTELVRVFKRQAGDARYDERGYSTPLLAQLMKNKLDADKAYSYYLRNLAPHQRYIGET